MSNRRNQNHAKKLLTFVKCTQVYTYTKYCDNLVTSKTFYFFASVIFTYARTLLFRPSEPIILQKCKVTGLPVTSEYIHVCAKARNRLQKVINPIQTVDTAKANQSGTRR